MILAAVNYDPEEEEGRKRPAHMTAKELRVYFIAAVVLIVLLTPLYIHLMDLRNSHVCRQNLLEIANAMEGYCDDNNDRYPPLYVTSDTGNEPKVFQKNEIFSWVSLLSAYTSKPAVFGCPASSDEEGVKNLDTKGKEIVSDYGMYAALSTLPRGDISDAESEVLIADSSSDGANRTYDPLPLKNEQGQIVPDGVSIGLDTTNLMMSDVNSGNGASQLSAIVIAKTATRLAAPDSAKGLFDEHTETRHPDGINVLSADLHLKRIHGPDIAVSHVGKAGAIVGLWATQ